MHLSRGDVKRVCPGQRAFISIPTLATAVEHIVVGSVTLHELVAVIHSSAHVRHAPDIRCVSDLVIPAHTTPARHEGFSGLEERQART
jgi:hypothetical protein